PAKRRRGTDEPRHLPSAGDRALLRRRVPRRVRDRRGAGRDDPDPRWGRARFRGGPAGAPRRRARNPRALSIVPGHGFRLRRAEPADVDFLVELATHEDIEPYLAAVRPRDRAAVLEEVERSQREPAEFGRFL